MRRAGKFLLDNYDNSHVPETKTDGTPVTAVDKRVSEMISSALEKEFPDYGILDEERDQDETRFTKSRCWVIDPLDGTREYISKTGDFGIIVGLLDNYHPVFGVTYKPHKDELMFAAREQGAYLLEGGRIRSLKVSESDEIHVLVSSSRSSEELDAMLRDLNPDSVAYMGGSLKMVEVAKGDATLFLCPTTSKISLWDLCGPSIILEGAGGRISDIYGNPFDYQSKDTANYKGVVATNGILHDKVLESIGYQKHS